MLYRRSHQGERASKPVSFEVGDDGLVRFAGNPGVVLATDLPVEEYLPGIGRARVVLVMKRSMIRQWKATGVLDPDGNLVMAVDHASQWNSDPALASGRWENLRIETRKDHEALVADPAFDPAGAAAWMRRIGAEPDDWQGMFSRGTIHRTSISWRGSPIRDERNKETPPLFRVEQWSTGEASWVALGADKMSGAGRSNKGEIMDPEELEAIVKQATKEAAEIGAREGARAAREAMAELKGNVVETTLEIADVKPAFDDSSSSWRSACSMAYRDLGKDAGEAIATARASDSPLDGLLAVIDVAQKKRQEKPEIPADVPAPVRGARSITGEIPNAYQALQDLATIMIARGLRNMPNQQQFAGLCKVADGAHEAARKVDPSWQFTDPSKYLIAFARSANVVGPDWYTTDPKELVEEVTQCWQTPSGARSASMGGMWLAGNNAMRMSSGSLDVMSSLRSGAQGSVVPANLPAVYLDIVTKIFLMVHDSQMHDLAGWGNNVTINTLNSQTLIRKDVAVNFDAVSGNLPLPEAFMWDEATEITTKARGLVWSLGWEAMFTNGGAEMVNTPAILAMRWMAAKVAHWFKVLEAGLYTKKGGIPTNVYTGAQDATTAALGEWFESVLNASAVARPVADPDGGFPQGVSADVVAMGQMEPTLLLHSTPTDRLVTDYFAPRQLSQINGTSQDQQHTSFERSIAGNTVRTNYLKLRYMYLLVTRGPAAAMTSVGLDGQGMTVTTSNDPNIRMLPSMVVRFTDVYDAHLTHPRGVYRNVAP